MIFDPTTKAVPKATAPATSSPKPAPKAPATATIVPVASSVRPVPERLKAPVVASFDPTAKAAKPEAPVQDSLEMMLSKLDAKEVLEQQYGGEEVSELVTKWLRKVAIAALAGKKIPSPPDKIQLAFESLRKRTKENGTGSWERSVLQGHSRVMGQLPDEEKQIWAVIGPKGTPEFQNLSNEFARKWLAKCRCEGAYKSYYLAKKVGHSYIFVDDQESFEGGAGI